MTLTLPLCRFAEKDDDLAIEPSPLSMNRAFGDKDDESAPSRRPNSLISSHLVQGARTASFQGLGRFIQGHIGGSSEASGQRKGHFRGTNPGQKRSFEGFGRHTNPHI